MSQILDAINKADRERKEQIQPQNPADLYRSIQGGTVAPRKRLPKVLPLMLLLGLCGTSYIAYLKMSQSNPVSDTTNKSSEIQKKQIPTKNSVPETVKRKESALPKNNLPEKKSIVIKDNNTAKKPNVADKNSHISDAAQNVKGTAPSNQVSNSLVKLTKIKKQHTNDDLLPLTPIKVKVARPIANKKVTPNVSRETSVRPNNTKAATSKSISPKEKPTAAWKKNIHITAIVYDSNPKKRFVLISGKKIYENGSLPNSTTQVVKILPQQIIINDGNGDVLIR